MPQALLSCWLADECHWVAGCFLPEPTFIQALAKRSARCDKPLDYAPVANTRLFLHHRLQASSLGPAPWWGCWRARRPCLCGGGASGGWLCSRGQRWTSGPSGQQSRPVWAAGRRAGRAWCTVRRPRRPPRPAAAAAWRAAAGRGRPAAAAPAAAAAGGGGACGRRLGAHGWRPQRRPAYCEGRSAAGIGRWVVAAHHGAHARGGFVFPATSAALLTHSPECSCPAGSALQLQPRNSCHHPSGPAAPNTHSSTKKCSPLNTLLPSSAQGDFVPLGDWPSGEGGGPEQQQQQRRSHIPAISFCTDEQGAYEELGRGACSTVRPALQLLCVPSAATATFRGCRRQRSRFCCWDCCWPFIARASAPAATSNRCKHPAAATASFTGVSGAAGWGAPPCSQGAVPEGRPGSCTQLPAGESSACARNSPVMAA